MVQWLRTMNSDSIQWTPSCYSYSMVKQILWHITVLRAVIQRCVQWFSAACSDSVQCAVIPFSVISCAVPALRAVFESGGRCGQVGDAAAAGCAPWDWANHGRALEPRKKQTVALLSLGDVTDGRLDRGEERGDAGGLGPGPQSLRGPQGHVRGQLGPPNSDHIVQAFARLGN